MRYATRCSAFDCVLTPPFAIEEGPGVEGVPGREVRSRAGRIMYTLRGCTGSAELRPALPRCPLCLGEAFPPTGGRGRTSSWLFQRLSPKPSGHRPVGHPQRPERAAASASTGSPHLGPGPLPVMGAPPGAARCCTHSILPVRTTLPTPRLGRCRPGLEVLGRPRSLEEIEFHWG